MESVHQGNQSCPLCTASAFRPTEEIFDLVDILTRWQSEAAVVLRESVWQEYTRPTLRQVTLYRCQNCGFARFQPPIAGSQEFYADVTAQDYYVSEKWEFFQAIKDIRKHESYRVLDIGCGSGDFLDLLEKKRVLVESFGFEFTPEAADTARSKGHTVIDGSFPEAVLTAGNGHSFDAICIFQVLEHFADPIAFLKDVRQLLKTQGILIVGVPDADGPIHFFSDALTDIPPHHVSRWCGSAFRIGMPALGFAVDKIKREPLPHYLWESYLPVMWETNIWPAVICRLLDNLKRMEKADRIRWFIDKMRGLKIRWLWGVPGHTLYTVLQFREK